MQTLTFVDTLMLYPFCRFKFSSIHQPLFSTNHVHNLCLTEIWNIQTSHVPFSDCRIATLKDWERCLLYTHLICLWKFGKWFTLSLMTTPRKRWHVKFIMHVIFAWDVVGAYFECCSCVQIVFVENKKLKSTLLEEIEESQLPDIYGGQMPLVPIQDSWLNHTF